MSARQRFCAVLLYGGLLSCGGADSVTAPPTPVVVQVKVTAPSTSVQVGKTLQLTAQALDASGSPMTKVISWTTNPTSVATVNSEGVVTGIAPGQVTISASTDGVTGTVNLTVTPVPVSTVLVTVPSSSITVAQTVTAVVILRDASGNELTGRSVAWSSLNQSVATVSPAGVVTGVSPGTTSIVATSEGVNGSAAIVVTAPPPGPAAAITKLRGDAQTAVVGTAVPIQPAVLVADANGRPVPGAPVTFTVTSGAGTLSNSSALSIAVVNTDADGVAAVGVWKLGLTAGPQTLTAAIGTGQSVVFTATAVASSAASFQKVSGDAQIATVGTAVPIAPSIKLLDANGNPVAGRDVTFAVVTGGGTVTGATKVTDANGIATVGGWTLGSVSGPNSLSATTTGVPSVVFTATARPGAPSTIRVVSGDQQSTTVATTASAPVVFEVKDALGNVVAPGTKVNFQISGGTVNPTSGLTDDVGRTQTSWTAPTVVGGYDGTATVDGTSVVANFRLFATGGQNQMFVTAGNGQSAVKGTAVPVRPTIQIRDEFGNPTPQLPVVFTVTAGGGSVTGATQTTDANGNATLGSWTLGERLLTPFTRTDTITVTVPGYPTLTATITANATYPAVAPVQTWESTTFGTSTSTPTYYGLSGTSSSDIWTAGAGSYVGGFTDDIRHFAGSTWDKANNALSATLRSIWSASSALVFAVGDAGTITRYNGSAWSDVTSPTSQRLNWVWGLSTSNIYAVGDGGTILRFDGISWSTSALLGGVSLRGMWARSANDVYVVGSGGYIAHFDGSVWTTMNSGVTQDLNAIWGYSANEIIAVGAQGVIVRYNGSAWITQQAPTTANALITYVGVWGTAPNDNYISFVDGSGGTTSGLIKYDMSGNPTAGTLPPNQGFGAASNPWGAGAGSDVWVVLHHIVIPGSSAHPPVIFRGRR